jgi:hypothetical protein
MAHRELKIALAGFFGARARLQGFDDILLNSPQERAQDVLAVPEAAINRGRIRTCGLRHGPHGESFIRPLFP